MNRITLYTDGACSGNPGKGGWGTIISSKGCRLEFARGYRFTTNNRMELLGIIQPLENIDKPSEVDIYTDSRYIEDSINKGWLRGWVKRGWKGTSKKIVKNIDLWKRFVPLLEKHDIRIHWIRGHNGHRENERCDEMAVAVRSKYPLSIDKEYEEVAEIEKQKKESSRSFKRYNYVENYG